MPIEVKEFFNSRIQTLSNLFGLDLAYFISGGFWLTSATIASGLGGIFLSALFARIWPPDVYGQFSFLMSVLGFVSLTSLPGMTQAVLQASTEQKDGVYEEAIKVVARWSFIGVALLLSGAIYFYLRQNTNLALAVSVCALVFPISSAGSLYSSFLTGKKQFNKVAIFNVVAQFVSIMATALALLIFSNFIVVVLFSTWSTALVSAALTYFSFGEIINKKEDRKLLALGKHLSFAQIFTVGADYLDRFLIPLLLGFTNNAIYSFAILIPMQLHGFMKMFSTLGQPKIAGLSSSELRRSLINKSLQLEILIVAIVVIYILAAPTIFQILYPTYQDSAVRLSQIFSLGLLYFPSNLFGLGIMKERATKTVYKIHIFYVLLTVLSLTILIPIWGLVGAVIAKIVVRFLSGGIQIYLFKGLEVEK